MVPACARVRARPRSRQMPAPPQSPCAARMPERAQHRARARASSCGALGKRQPCLLYTSPSPRD
eukprot:2261675-Alexandrium_andersonii.AAC.1